MASLKRAESHFFACALGSPEISYDQENALLTADCYPITVVPGLRRLFLDYCSGAAAAQQFHASFPSDQSWQERKHLSPQRPAHWPEMVRLLAEQNASSSPAAEAALDALRNGAGVVVTGQQAEQLRPVCGPLRRKVLPLLPTLVRRGRGVEPLRRCRAGAVVQKQPMQSWHDGDGITVCGQQRILLVIENLWSNPMHMKKMGFCSVKDATPGPIDARV
jgi:hypothetical protein